MSEAARGQGPDDMVHARAMKHDNDGLALLELATAGGREDGFFVDLEMHGDGLRGFLRDAQCLGQVVDDVAGRFEANRKAHEILAHTGFL
jgi:hypothetical protein